MCPFLLAAAVKLDSAFYNATVAGMRRRQAIIPVICDFSCVQQRYQPCIAIVVLSL